MLKSVEIPLLHPVYLYWPVSNTVLAFRCLSTSPHNTSQISVQIITWVSCIRRYWTSSALSNSLRRYWTSRLRNLWLLVFSLFNTCLLSVNYCFPSVFSAAPRQVISITSWGMDLTSWFPDYAGGAWNVPRLWSIILFQFDTWSYILIMQFMY